MNVAFPTLILFLVLLPGFLLRNGLKRAERSSVDFSPFGQVVATAVLWAVFAHLDGWACHIPVFPGLRTERAHAPVVVGSCQPDKSRTSRW